MGGLLVVAATTIALAAPGDAADHPVPAPHDVRAEMPRGAQWTAPTRPAAVRLADVAATAEGALGYTFPTADLTGDGVPDVVSFAGAGDQVRMTCRSGTNGRVFGSLVLSAESYVEYVDSAWRAAIVYETTATPADVTPADDARLTVRWVERCRQRWVRVFTAAGEDPAAGVADGDPFFAGTLDSSTGRAAVVVQTLTSVPVSPVVSRTVVHVVSGDDGSSLYRGDPVEFVDEYPRLLMLPDVSGDGLGDYGYAVDDAVSPPQPSRGDRLAAFASDDGRRLWTLPTPTVLGPHITRVGDADGDGTSDFVLSQPSGHRETVLVSGATGTALWRRGPGLPRVVASSPLLVTISRLETAAGWYWLEVTALDVRGSQRHAGRHRVAPTTDATGTYHRQEALGDVDADGAIDVVHRISVTYENDSERSLNLVVSGRRGTTRTADVRSLVAYGWLPGTATFDGRGDDVWSPGTLAIRSGDRGTEIARWRGGAVAEMFVTRIDHDTCPDLFVVTGRDPFSGTWDENTPRQLLMVSGATGNVVWSLPASKPGRHVLDGRLGTCTDSPPAPALPPPAVARPPARIPATGAAPAWGAVVVAATAVVAGRLRRRAPAG